MITHPSPLFSRAVAAAALALSTTALMAAAVTDDFSGTYPGGGSGWLNDWNYRHYRTTDPNSKAEYRDTNPLSGSDNYLAVRYNRNVSGSGGYSIISRAFDPLEVDNQQAHRITFDFRLDYATHWNHTGERIAFFAAAQNVSRSTPYAPLNPTASSPATWGISYDGANGWTIIESDGAGGVRYTSPGVLFKSAADASTVYQIILDIDPDSKSYSVSISDGDRTEKWDDTLFNFVNPSATASGNFLHFYADTRNGVQVEYAVSGLRVEQIPEPGTAALVGVAAMGFGLRKLAKKNR